MWDRHIVWHGHPCTSKNSFQMNSIRIKFTVAKIWRVIHYFPQSTQRGSSNRCMGVSLCGEDGWYYIQKGEDQHFLIRFNSAGDLGECFEILTVGLVPFFFSITVLIYSIRMNLLLMRLTWQYHFVNTSPMCFRRRLVRSCIILPLIIDAM